MSAEIPDGAVIIARAILNSSLWTMRPEDCKLAVTCIALANWKDRPWFDGEAEIVVKRGQFVRSREELAKACNLSLQQTRTSVQHLEKVGFLTRHSTRRYTVYTLPKYDFYQDLARYSDSVNPESNPRLTRAQPEANHKQEGEEGKEGGGRVSDRIGGLITAFRFCKSPGDSAKRNALDDLIRQGVTYERLLAAATDPASRALDFYEIVKTLRPKRGGGNHAVDPGYVRDFSE